jgi:integrase/recombinase XerD
MRNYEFVLNNLQSHFGDVDLSSLNSDYILDFMSKMSEGTKQSTKKLRFTLLTAFFNLIKNSVSPDFQSREIHPI